MTANDLDTLMTKKEVAEFLAGYFKQSVRHVMERTMYLPDFPIAVVLPTTGNASPRQLRWRESDIKDWLKKGLKRAA